MTSVNWSPLKQGLHAAPKLAISNIEIQTLVGLYLMFSTKVHFGVLQKGGHHARYTILFSRSLSLPLATAMNNKIKTSAKRRMNMYTFAIKVNTFTELFRCCVTLEQCVLVHTTIAVAVLYHHHGCMHNYVSVFFSLCIGHTHIHF